MSDGESEDCEKVESRLLLSQKCKSTYKQRVIYLLPGEKPGRIGSRRTVLCSVLWVSWTCRSASGRQEAERKEDKVSCCDERAAKTRSDDPVCEFETERGGWTYREALPE